MQYLKSTLSQNDFDKLDFAKSKIFALKIKTWEFKYLKKETTIIKFLLLQNKNSNYSGNWVDMSGITKTHSHFSSGNIVLISLDQIVSTKLTVDSNIVIEKENILSVIQITCRHFLILEKIHRQSDNPSLPENATPVLPEILIYYE